MKHMSKTNKRWLNEAAREKRFASEEDKEWLRLAAEAEAKLKPSPWHKVDVWFKSVMDKFKAEKKNEK